jgi:diadenosine tetraphosphate (Ap4A) HIT family hydrolase
MAIITETDNFVVESAERPHIDRRDGGHIRILPKKRVSDRTRLPLNLAKELVILSMVVGEAMRAALNKRGIDVGRINYQENGNWGVFKPEGPYLHLHLYGRARSAKIQPFGQAIRLPSRETGFYDKFEPLNQGDIRQIRSEIERVMAKRKYLSQVSLQTRS